MRHRSLWAIGIAWVVGVSLVGAALSLRPLIFLVPVVVVLTAWLASRARWHRAISIASVLVLVAFRLAWQCNDWSGLSAWRRHSGVGTPATLQYVDVTGTTR